MRSLNRWAAFVWIAIGVVASTAVASSAEAQRNPISFGILAGATKGIGDLDDVAELGYHVGALVQWSGATSPIGIRAEGVYHRFGIKDLPDEIDGHLSILSGTANAVFMIPADKSSPVRPYLIGGGGIYRLSFACDGCGTADIPDPENKFGLNGGGGLNFALSGFTAFVEARYHHIFTDEDSAKMVPVSFGIMFNP